MAENVRLDFQPFAHQREAHVLREKHRFLVLVWHRRAGKTVFAVMELVLAALASTRKDSRFGYICPFLNQAKGISWSYLKRFALAVPGVTISETELSVTFPNGSVVRLFGADNPKSLRGFYFDGVLLDEVADMRSTVWGETVRPSLSDRLGWAMFIGTPKGTNLFSDLYYQGVKGDDPEWASDLRRASQTGVIPKEELDKASAAMSPAEYAQEWECDFSAAADNVLLRLDEVREAQTRAVTEPEYSFAAKVLGLDVARYGDDKNCIFPRQGLASFTPKVWHGVDLMATAGRLCDAIDKWQPDAVFVDAGGYGAGVIDRCRQLGHVVIGVDFGGRALEARFENKRAEMWWQMADWVKAGGCLPDSSELASDLTAPTITYRNAKGRMQLESKDEMRKRIRRSPDIGDALALTFASPVAPKARFGGRDAASHAVTEYDPYATPATRASEQP